MSKRPPIFYEDDFLEHTNIGWRVNPGKPCPDNPLMEPKYSWDSGCPFSHGTVLIDPFDGKWKMWYISTPYAEEDNSFDRRLTYAVSDDGIHWERPLLDIVPYKHLSPGKTNVQYLEELNGGVKREDSEESSVEYYDKTNILLDHSSGGFCSFVSVFINEGAKEEERYEMFVFRGPLFGGPKEDGIPYVEGFSPVKKKDAKWLCRYFSSDGIHWNPADGPIDFETSDSCWIYKELKAVTGHQYIAQHKDMLQGELPTGFKAKLPPFEIAYYTPEHSDNCRVQYRRTSEDGVNWSDPELVFAPDMMDPLDTQPHELTVFPYSDKGMVGFLAIDHCNEQGLEQYFAGSRDGSKWWRPSRLKPCVPLEPLGDYGGGSIFGTRMLVEEGDIIHLYYAGLTNQHNNVYADHRGCNPFNGAIMRRSWKTGRFYAAVTSQGGDSEGQLLTPVQKDLKGKSLVVNVVTEETGKFEAELIGHDNKPIEGFSRQDCIPLNGDHLRKTFTWKSGDLCPVSETSVKVYFKRTKLYGFEWI